jgi:hypothetical protein
MQKYQVTCISKHSLYERIESIGCIDTTNKTEHRFTEDEAIRRIENHEVCFHVLDANGDEALVEVEEREGRKYLITKKDGIKTDNLLALPACTAKKVVVPPPYRPVAPARSHAVRGSLEWLK